MEEGENRSDVEVEMADNKKVGGRENGSGLHIERGVEPSCDVCLKDVQRNWSHAENTVMKLFEIKFVPCN